jgi:hypothetical protein
LKRAVSGGIQARTDSVQGQAGQASTRFQQSPMSKSARIRFAYPPELVHRPIIYALSKRFELVTNIHRAKLGDAESWAEMELVGAPTDIAAGLGWLRRQGVLVARVEVSLASIDPSGATSVLVLVLDSPEG